MHVHYDLLGILLIHMIDYGFLMGGLGHKR